MENNPHRSLHEILEEYFTKLKSSKDKDPQKNLLYQEIVNELTVMAAGMASVSHYEEQLNNDFITFWKSFNYDGTLAQYIEQFNTRLKTTTDRDKLFSLEINTLDKYNAMDQTTNGDIRQDGEKLGHLLAITGENPIINSLINNLTTHDFGIEMITANMRTELLNEAYWKRLRDGYSETFSKLTWVCRGYLDAQKLKYVRDLQQAPTNTADNTQNDNDTNSTKLTLKQQVLLMQKLGFFELEPIKPLTMQNLGKLLGRLFGRNEKNTEDLIRNRQGKNVDKKYSLEGSEVTEAVNALLTELKIKL
jgi:hypothetical protein